eukprot:FR738039.1.p1 GENE.FR738039.1~~FR738039.1.p1  ORF type:complete len:140 (-),score=4.92 FR738039.1:124-504(-)
MLYRPRSQPPCYLKIPTPPDSRTVSPLRRDIYATMSIKISNKNEPGFTAMAIKLGDVTIKPGEEAEVTPYAPPYMYIVCATWNKYQLVCIYKHRTSGGGVQPPPLGCVASYLACVCRSVPCMCSYL